MDLAEKLVGNYLIKILVFLFKIIDSYSGQLFSNNTVKEGFNNLKNKIEEELEDQKNILNILGKLDIIIDASE